MSREQFLSWNVFLTQVQGFGPEYEDEQFARLTAHVFNLMGEKVTADELMPQWKEVEEKPKQTAEQNFALLQCYAAQTRR